MYDSVTYSSDLGMLKGKYMKPKRILRTQAALISGLALLAASSFTSCHRQSVPIEFASSALSFTHDPYRLTGDRIATGGPSSQMLLARVTDDGGVQARFFVGSWTNWRDLGKPNITSGLAISHYGNYYTIYGRSANGLSAITYDAGTSTWGGWFNLTEPTGGITSAPSVVTWPSGKATVFVRGSGGSVHAKDFNSTSWGAWYSLGGNIASAPSAWIDSGYLTIAATNAADGKFALNTFNGTTWGGWYSVANPGTLSSAIVPVKNGTNTFLFGLGTDGTIQLATWNGASWAGSSLGGTLSSMPTAIASGSHTTVFSRHATDSKLYALTHDGTSWGWWYKPAAWDTLELAAPPSAFFHGSTVRVYGLDTVGAMNETYHNGSWQPWTSVSYGTADTSPGTITDVLKNPGMGWMLEEFGYMTGSDGLTPDPNHYPSSYCRNAAGNWGLVDTIELMDTWSWIQRGGPTSYDWTRLDNMIAFWVGKGKRISLRVSTEDIGCYEPFFGDGLMPGRAGCAGPPSWLWGSVAKYCYADPGATFEYPDYTDPDYQIALHNFMTAYGARYNGNPNVDLVILRGFGQWGEWHSSGYHFANDIARMNHLAWIATKWSQVFPNKILPMSVSYEYREPNSNWNIDTLSPATYDFFKEISAFDTILTLPNVAARRDGYDGNLYEIIRPDYDGRFINEAFTGPKRLPNVAEFFFNYKGAKYVDTGMGIEDKVPTVLNHMLSYHNNYAMMLGWACVVSMDPAAAGLDALAFYNGEQTEIQRMLRSGGLGYRFELPSATYPHHLDSGTTAFSVTTTWRNVNVGRAITNYWLKFYLVNTTTGVTAWSGLHQTADIRDWVAGSDNTVNASWTAANGWVKPPAGEYQLMVALVNQTTGDSAVQLALPHRDSAGRYPLGTLYVY